MDTNSNSASGAGLIRQLAARRFAVASWGTLHNHTASDPATVLREVTIAALESKNFPTAVRATINRLCDKTGWPIGNGWRKLATGGWESMNVWHHAAGTNESRPSPDRWREITDQLTSLATAESFDHISVNRGPQCLNAETNPSASAGSDASPFHLQAVVAFPVIAQERVVAVVQLYSQMSLELDEVFKNLLRQSGMLLGYVFEREQMERRIAQLAEIERSQIAQQLHDGLSQHLAAAAMLVESLKLRLANEGSSQTEMTTKTLLALEEAKQQARALGKMLAPTMSHSDGIAVALSEVAEESRHAFNVDCVLECRGTTAHINRFTAEQLVRFARDAIRYMHKNCRATHISMIMQSEPGMSISIRGNGRAPDIAPRNQEDDLRALQTRAHLIGGEFSIQCNGPDGTTITCASETNFGQ